MPNSRETREQREKREVDERLDRELEQSFPASDPPTVTRNVPYAPTVKLLVDDKEDTIY